ncbi:MAG: GNAT family N-acetyltransferase [Clostridia bacterium]|nr:GNAT family N-acetyltransferase [Clostridia bacterium]
MTIIDLTEDQCADIEGRLSEFDESRDPFQLEGCIRIGAEEGGRLIAGLDACVTAFRILYVSTVFVDEAYRRQGVGARLMAEMEKRAAGLGVNTIRLDTFDWQGREFYEALGYECVGHYENAGDGYSEYFYLKRLG